MAPVDEYHRFEREIDRWRIRRKDADDRKSVDEVFDKRNLMRIYKLFSDGVIDRFDFPIATGKEGNVFRASNPEGKLVAVKIYRTSTATFKDMAKYVLGDPRFKGTTRNKQKLIMDWARKEYLNLERFHRYGIRVPKPIAIRDNIIVMEYIGDEVMPAREMRDVPLDNPEEIAGKILGYIKTAYQKARLVHGDISEFNVLMLGSEPVIIDVGQAVMLDHPLSGELLERDVRNLARYFRRYKMAIDASKELAEIRKK
ncbi:MAG TPA: serine protein kinase RIO [Thermoplasmata archaeon]